MTMGEMLSCASHSVSMCSQLLTSWCPSLLGITKLASQISICHWARWATRTYSPVGPLARGVLCHMYWIWSLIACLPAATQSVSRWRVALISGNWKYNEMWGMPSIHVLVLIYLETSCTFPTDISSKFLPNICSICDCYIIMNYWGK